MFSRDPAGREHLKPDSVTQRYGRLVARLGIKTSIHKLRTYNATELLAGGLDIRTAAGRLGHSDGGVTTMRHYVPWVTEADQRAAGTIGPRMPPRPPRAELPPQVEFIPKRAFEKVAVELRDRIYGGDLAVGLPIPSVKELARQHGMAPSTAQRAVQLLSQWGLVRIEPGLPTLVAPQLAEVESRPPKCCLFLRENFRSCRDRSNLRSAASEPWLRPSARKPTRRMVSLYIGC
jgi:integrase